MFQNRKLIIATKHQKESVIAPILEKELGINCFINETFDTDTLGTFTGEIERKLDPISTAREKCLQAMKLSNCDLGIASEGSFGPHPSMIFINADDEFLIFIDTLNHIEIIVRELSTSTNFNGKQIVGRKTVELMTTNQIGDLEVWDTGNKFGLGFEIVTEKGVAKIHGSVGAFKWGGAYSTDYIIDPTEDLIMLIYTNVLPFANPDINKRFRIMVYQALVTEKK